ncbi:uncharacterized protein MONBRDRAFT_33337 [Monosiga brevicollis MX1]|uniref:WW domain-containing protein n=1 Tax=Monosiga brevicollis TaxID=81824 RepID=A9V4T7_MONBE|nr:uncharacterized protein MONBRDRAFT_33337 [Monosiga brevicollis MX1]EDQ87426.1 predicted protein [Monosiga brevicollis MX1]|eukprot:XP_001747686.1 hypothetical protein [Monosiga brevicollis MX1]
MATATENDDLPQGWEEIWDPTMQKMFYVDHNTQTTTWVHPNHRNMSDMLPEGWERAWDNECGDYYIDHNTWSTFLPEELMARFRDREMCQRMLAMHREEARRLMEQLDQTMLRLKSADKREAKHLKRRAAELQRNINLKIKTIQAFEEEMDRFHVEEATAGIVAVDSANVTIQSTVTTPNGRAPPPRHEFGAAQTSNHFSVDQGTMPASVEAQGAGVGMATFGADHKVATVDEGTNPDEGATLTASGGGSGAGMRGTSVHGSNAIPANTDASGSGSGSATMEDSATFTTFGVATTSASGGPASEAGAASGNGGADMDIGEPVTPQKATNKHLKLAESQQIPDTPEINNKIDLQDIEDWDYLHKALKNNESLSDWVLQQPPHVQRIFEHRQDATQVVLARRLIKLKELQEEQTRLHRPSSVRYNMKHKINAFNELSSPKKGPTVSHA